MTEIKSLPESLKAIDGEYEEWVHLWRIPDDVEISAGVETISCDTRDFALGWSFNQPKSYKKAECNLEKWTNEGLARMNRLRQSPAIGDYLIAPSEIIPWLKKLCEKSGGYDEDWRYIMADVDGCRNWDIKYIRFVKHTDGRFFVCNTYWLPIKFRKILDNLVKLP